MRNVKLHNIFTRHQMFSNVKPRWMRWAEHVIHMGETWELRTKFWSEDLMGRDHLEDRGLDYNIKWILVK